MTTLCLTFVWMSHPSSEGKGKLSTGEAVLLTLCWQPDHDNTIIRPRTALGQTQTSDMWISVLESSKPQRHYLKTENCSRSRQKTIILLCLLLLQGAGIAAAGDAGLRLLSVRRRLRDRPHRQLRGVHAAGAVAPQRRRRQRCWISHYRVSSARHLPPDQGQRRRRRPAGEQLAGPPWNVEQEIVCLTASSCWAMHAVSCAQQDAVISEVAGVQLRPEILSQCCCVSDRRTAHLRGPRSQHAGCPGQTSMRWATLLKLLFLIVQLLTIISAA